MEVNKKKTNDGIYFLKNFSNVLLSLVLVIMITLTPLDDNTLHIEHVKVVNET